MSGSDSSALVLARSTAVVGLGIMSGLSLSIPAWTWPALYRPDSTLTPAQRLGIWSTLYSRGKKTFVAAIPTVTALLSYAAYAARPPVEYLPAGWVARNRRFILAAAAMAAVGNMAFTFAVMEKLNASLKKVEKNAMDGSPVTAAHDTTIRTRWARLHAVRCVLGLVAFVAAVSELALA